MFEPCEVATGPPALALLLECREGIDQEQLGVLEVLGQLFRPIVADVGIDVGVGLDKEDPAPGGRHGEHFGNACRAVFLLS